MASNYTGLYTNVQAPATAPAVNNSPVGSLIQDADGNTAANLYQAWKVCLDNLDLTLRILGGTLTAKGIQVDGTGGATSTVTGGVVQSKSLALSDLTTVFNPGAGHICCRGTVPTFSPGTGAGTGPTITLPAGNTDTRGIVSVLTGTAPAGSNAFIVAINFANTVNTSMSGALCLLTPANAAAAALNGTTQVFSTVNSNTNTQFSIISGTAALTAATQYVWNYFMVG